MWAPSKMGSRLAVSRDYDPAALIPALVESSWRARDKRRREARVEAETEDDLAVPAGLEIEATQRLAHDGAPLSFAEAQRVKENYLALLRQLQYDQESGKVVAVDDVAAAVAAEYGIVRSRLLGLPAKIAPLLVGLPGPNEAKAILETEIFRVLEELTVARDEQDVRARFGAPE